MKRSELKKIVKEIISALPEDANSAEASWELEGDSTVSILNLELSDGRLVNAYVDFDVEKVAGGSERHEYWGSQITRDVRPALEITNYTITNVVDAESNTIIATDERKLKTSDPVAYKEITGYFESIEEEVLGSL